MKYKNTLQLSQWLEENGWAKQPSEFEIDPIEFSKHFKALAARPVGERQDAAVFRCLTFDKSPAGTPTGRTEDHLHAIRQTNTEHASWLRDNMPSREDVARIRLMLEIGVGIGMATLLTLIGFFAVQVAR